MGDGLVVGGLSTDTHLASDIQKDRIATCVYCYRSCHFIVLMYYFMSSYCTFTEAIILVPDRLIS